MANWIAASRLLCLIPRGVPRPDIWLDDDGALILEWDYGPRQVFAISIASDGSLAYAGLFGQTPIHSVGHLNDGGYETIVACLERFKAQQGDVCPVGL